MSAPTDELAEFFGLADAFPVEPRWNAAPTQELPVVRVEDGARRLASLRWGLVPPAAEDLSVGSRMINARVETVATRPSFRAALRRRRCLVPATGFYEWSGPPKGRRAWLVRRMDGRPFAFAGLWESWRPPLFRGAREIAGRDAIETFAIVTVPSREAVLPLHDRMPAIVEPGDYAKWLDPRVESPAELLPLLRRQAPATPLEVVPVGTAVNDARRDDPSCAEPVPT